MSDLIRRKDAIDAIDREMTLFRPISPAIAHRNFRRRIMDVPEVLPKIGKWINCTSNESLDEEWKCSECGFELFYVIEPTNFCPNCGEKMIGGGNG